MNENKLKHLEFIQNVIARMNSNSFLIKGWSVTLMSASFALAAKDANTLYIYACYISIPAFWILDGFFLSQERQYRDLYNLVALKPCESIDFSMNATIFNKENRTWFRSVLSKTLIPFHGGLLLAVVVIMRVI